MRHGRAPGRPPAARQSRAAWPAPPAAAIRKAHHSITGVCVSTRRMLVRPAVMASVGRCSIIGIETTLTAKISVANSAPSSTQAMMKLMFSGSSSASSEPLKSGMPSKVTAKTTSVARAQTISSTSSTKPKMASCAGARLPGQQRIAPVDLLAAFQPLAGAVHAQAQRRAGEQEAARQRPARRPAPARRP